MFRNPITWILLAIALVLALAAVNIIKSRPISPRSQIVSSTKTVTKLPSQVRIFPSDPVRGAAEAPITIIEFGDFECGYCAQAAVTLEKFIQDNPGKLKLIWKDFPLPSHIQAKAAAEAAQCAARQGRFWQYHDALFQRQGNLNGINYLNLAGEAGLNFESFTQCLQNHETLPLVQLNIAEGAAVGVDGTPFFIINGEVFSGLLSADDLTALIK